MAHTPGPWSTFDRLVQGPGGAPVAAVHGRYMYDNARLIAAAPELLAACQEAVSAITYLLSNDDDDPNYADTLNTLAAAIAKAEGRAHEAPSH